MIRDFKIKDAYQKIVLLAIPFIISIVLFRVYEFAFLFSSYDLPRNTIKLEFIGLAYDILQFMVMNFFATIVYLAIYLISPKLAKVFYKTLSILVNVFYIILIQYFVANVIPLDRVLLNYPLSDIIHTLRSSADFSFFMIIPFLTIIPIMLVFYRLLRNVKFKNVVLIAFVIVNILSVLAIKYSTPSRNKFDTNFEYYLVSNKVTYFFYDIFNYSTAEEINYNALSIKTATEKYHLDHKQYHFLNDKYPFLRHDNSNDVLGKYFNTKEQNPNFVFIIVESLSRAFSGNNAYMGSFTPYLDSLANKGLSWNNFLSTAERTFGVLPSVLGSLPYGEKGFLEMGDKMPDHISFLRLLENKGYYTSFLHGGWTHFDNMDLFFNKQGIDFILEYFGQEYSEMDSTGIGFTWGYADKDLFKRSVEVIDSINTNPRIDIYLTISTHNPYRIPEQEYYKNVFSERLKTLKFDKEKIEEYEKMSTMFASVMYFDDAIKQLMEEYKKREDYENTIFIITGDHRMPGIPISDIDNFHVPFIIYSPMLKTSQQFSSISSHNNVTPTLLAFLRENYNMNFPDTVHWLDNVIDTTKLFRNIHSLPFIRHNKKITQFLDKEFFLYGDQLFAVSDNLKLTPLEDKKAANKIKDKLNNFIFINDYACKNNLLYPRKLFFESNNLDLLYNAEIDFENQNSAINDIYKSNISSDLAYQGNNSVFMADDVEYSNILTKQFLETNYKNIEFEAEFYINLKDTTSENMPTLVLELFDSEKKHYWKSINLKTDENVQLIPNKWNAININIQFNSRTYKLGKGCYLFAYIWNTKKTEMYYDNLKIKIIGEKINSK